MAYTEPANLSAAHGDFMPVRVLLIEDNVGDARLTREALREVDTSIELHVVKDGVEAIEYLKSPGPPRPVRPDFILLDLNLPKMNGFEVLAQIKADRELKRIPTVVLSTSDAESDVERSYRLYANSYVNKPRRWDEFERLVRSINTFWLTAATLPG
jgi:chemotaxis family two-component system response regulator Rcp1